MSSLLDPAHCSQSAEWSVGNFPGAVCDHTVNFHRFAFNNPTPSSLKGKDAIITNEHGIKTLRLTTFKCNFVDEEAVANLEPLLTSTGDYWELMLVLIKNSQVLKRTLKQVFLIVIIPPVHTDHYKISSKCFHSVSDWEQNQQCI